MAVTTCGRGQTFIEYSVLIAVIGATLVGMSIYGKRALSGRWRAVGDAFGFGRQYEVRTPQPVPVPPPAPPLPPPAPPSAPEPGQCPPGSPGNFPDCGEGGNDP